jgi:hypothetical protein
LWRQQLWAVNIKKDFPLDYRKLFLWTIPLLQLVLYGTRGRFEHWPLLRRFLNPYSQEAGLPGRNIKSSAVPEDRKT